MRYVKKAQRTVICEQCHAEFSTSVKHHRFCGVACRRDNERETNPYRSGLKELGIPTGTVGAIGELRVCVDLLSKGYEVFRAVSACCSCDLAIRKNGSLIELEVRTGYENKQGELKWSKHGTSKQWAVVLPTRIVYVPELQRNGFNVIVSKTHPFKWKAWHSQPRLFLGIRFPKP